ncbi:DUF3261 domain-containing protein [Pseudoxanthomonas dokdonensis]|uniref:DUF3261 domain-containing protein n=1 Tax=Pseudoxanthomonas dokdonensis TaxID=344882 RepID=UPI000ADC4134|nr:DUF3261 domain-containing protein [Pseudoxanthomonas dokdonensis]
MSFCLCVLLVGCATQAPPAPVAAADTLPPLRLSPASLGRSLSLQQRLTFLADGRQRSVEALLEADPQQVQLLVLAMGQTGSRLRWDGQTLQEQRAAWLPPQVQGARVLDDLQLSLWPAPAIQAALPAGWQLQADGDHRVLSHDGQPRWTMQRLAADTIRLDNLVQGYQLTIETAAEAVPSDVPAQ